jgi:hypothetical protein
MNTGKDKKRVFDKKLLLNIADTSQDSDSKINMSKIE